jgi:hypothetical protein
VPPITALPTPVLTGLKASPTRWRLGSLLPAIATTAATRPPIGTTISFRLNVASTLRFAFTRPGRGRRSGAGCVAPSSRNQGRPPCTRRVDSGTLSLAAPSGAGTIRLQGRITRGPKLRPGRYTARVTATNAEGKTSAPQTLRFTIVR